MDTMQRCEMKSPYRQGAEDGLVFGLYLGIIVFCVIFSVNVPALSLPVLLMIMFTPVLIFFMQRRYYVAEGGYATTSAMWMQGLVMSACGGLLAFVSAYIYMKWISPGYLDRVYQDGIQSMMQSGVPEIETCAAEMDKMTGGRNIVSPKDFCLAMIWVTILGGSLTSLVTGIINGFIPVSKNKK